jgi:glutamine cyclotransferase
VLQILTLPITRKTGLYIQTTKTLLLPYFSIFLWCIIGFSFFSCSPSTDKIPKYYTYQIVEIFPHDENAFTQGLFFEGGLFLESTGRYGNSSVRKVDPPTGDIVKMHELPDQFFGEGLTVVGNHIIQLTWRSKVGFVYDKESLELQKEFSYQTEGWGITYDGNRLIMSDGSAKLFFLDVKTFEQIGTVEVFDRDTPITRLNELEFIHGEIFANVWGTESIVRINPQTGEVTGWISLQGLLDRDTLSRPVDVLNGIAYDEINNRIFVTGKLWPKIFHITLVPVDR